MACIIEPIPHFDLHNNIVLAGPCNASCNASLKKLPQLGITLVPVCGSYIYEH